MLRNLDENEALIVVDAMEEYKVKAGETVIKEGEKGDELFVVESGSLDCFINIVICNKIFYRTVKANRSKHMQKMKHLVNWPCFTTHLELQQLQPRLTVSFGL